MDTFLMVCYVCADFVGKSGEFFSVKSKDLGTFVQAPAWIKETIMFKWLLADGSIKIGLEKAEQKKLENNPMEGITAEGKAETDEEAPKPKKTSARAKKGEVK